MPEGQVHLASFWRKAIALSVVTIAFNILEGAISTFFGARDESLSLFGFGVDSFAEVASSVGILLMTWRISSQSTSAKSSLERRAFMVTSISFFVISGALLVSAASSILVNHSPRTTLPGTLVSLLSIGLMLVLVRLKRQVGTVLGSEPILADARCGEVCIYMSVVLLASSLLYLVSGIGFVDSIGALGLSFLSLREGRSSWIASQSTKNSCCSC